MKIFFKVPCPPKLSASSRQTGSNLEHWIDCEESVIPNLYKGKGEALDHGYYHCLKLTNQVMKLLELVLDFSIHQMVNISKMQFAFVPGRGTTEAVFMVH